MNNLNHIIMKTLHVKQSKIGTVFLTLFLLAAIATSCTQPPQTHEDQITDKDIIALRENHIISLKDAVKSYKKYGQERSKILKDTLKKKYGGNFTDSRSVWIDIKTIKTYLSYLEKTSKDSIEGLQFYFNVDLEDQGNKKNHQSFFVAPTKKNGNKQSGFTIVKGETRFLYEAFKESQETSGNNVQKGSFFSFMQEEDGLLLNKGVPNPPGDNN